MGELGVIVVSAWHEYVGGTHSSDSVCIAADVIGMSVVHGMRGVGGVCEMCMCLARGGVGSEGDEWIRGLGLGFLFVCCCWSWIILDITRLY